MKKKIYFEVIAVDAEEEVLYQDRYNTRGHPRVYKTYQMYRRDIEQSHKDEKLKFQKFSHIKYYGEKLRTTTTTRKEITRTSHEHGQRKACQEKYEYLVDEHL